MRDRRDTDEEDAEWQMNRNDEWPDPDPDPPLADQFIGWLKNAGKSFANLFGGYLFLLAGWLFFTVLAFYVSFLMAGAVKTPPGITLGFWELMAVGSEIVMTTLYSLNDAEGMLIISMSLVAFAGGAITLYSYIKLKRLLAQIWNRFS